MSLDPARFALDEHVNCNWTVTVEAGTSLEDVANPAFFANIAAKLHPYDHIRVRIDTGEYYAVLLVLDCGRAWAKTFVLSKHDLTKNHDEGPSAGADKDYLIKFQGPHKKWCVIRKSDKEVIKEGCSAERDANLWLSQYVVTL